VYRRLGGEVRQKSSTWRLDETFVRIAGRWLYLFRAVDSAGQTLDIYLSETHDREAAKLFLERALANPDNRPPHVFARDGLRSYPAAIRELQSAGRLHDACRQRIKRYCNSRLNQIIVTSNGDCGPCKGRARPAATAWNVVQGIEAVQIIRKGQVLVISRQNLFGEARVFGALLHAGQSLAASDR
jgi:transposase, IS6 family